MQFVHLGSSPIKALAREDFPTPVWPIITIWGFVNSCGCCDLILEIRVDTAIKLKDKFKTFIVFNFSGNKGTIMAQFKT